MKTTNAFTLIELLVVITIISILSVVGFVAFQNVQKNAKDAKIRADIDAIKKAYETNFDVTLNNGQGGYKALSPTNFAGGKIPTPDGTTNTSYIVVGSDATGANNNPDNFLICSPINGATGTCSANSSTCYCASSSGGSGTASYVAPPAACSTITVWSSNPSASITGCHIYASVLPLGVPSDGTGVVYTTCPAAGNQTPIKLLNLGCPGTSQNLWAPSMPVYGVYSGGTSTLINIYGIGTSDYNGNGSVAVTIKLRNP